MTIVTLLGSTGLARGEVGLLDTHGDGTAEYWRPWVEVFFHEDDVDAVVCTIEWESSGNPLAWGDGGLSLGLLQIQTPMWKAAWLSVGQEMSFQHRYNPILSLYVMSLVVYYDGGLSTRQFGTQPFGANPWLNWTGWRTMCRHR